MIYELIALIILIIPVVGLALIIIFYDEKKKYKNELDSIKAKAQLLLNNNKITIDDYEMLTGQKCRNQKSVINQHVLENEHRSDEQKHIQSQHDQMELEELIQRYQESEIQSQQSSQGQHIYQHQSVQQQEKQIYQQQGQHVSQEHTIHDQGSMQPIRSQAVNQKNHSSVPKEFNQGTLALVIGVLFVIIAGLIFATTTWRILPSTVKAILVLSVTGIFFGASIFADKKLKIKTTSNAFYILGSAFTFVTVIAFGYFRILGDTLTPAGTDCIWLYFIAATITDIVLFLGVNKIKVRMFSMIPLIGTTISVILCVGGFHPAKEVYAIVLAVYVIIVLLSNQIIKKIENEFIDNIKEVYWTYCLINLYGVSVFVLTATGFGILGGIASVIIASAHVFVGIKEGRDEVSPYAFTIFAVAAAAKIIAPNESSEWLYIASTALLMVTILSQINVFSEKFKKSFGIINLITGVLIIIVSCSQGFFDGKVTLSEVISLGILLGDITYLGIKSKSKYIHIVHYIVLIIFSISISVFASNKGIIRLTILTLILESVFIIYYFTKCIFRNSEADIIYNVTVFLTIFSLNILIQFKNPDVLNLSLAVITSAVYAATILFQSRENKSYKYLFPYILSGVTVPLWELINIILKNNFAINNISYRSFFFGFFLLYLIYDLLFKKENYIALTVMGMLVQFILYVKGFDQTSFLLLPYSLCLGIYLVIKSKDDKSKVKFLLGLSNFLFGVHILSYKFSSIFIISIIIPMALLIAVYFIAKFMDKLEYIKWYFNIAYLTLAGILMTIFYSCNLSAWYLLPCIVLLIFGYFISYFTEKSQLHIGYCLISLGIPFILVDNYGLKYDFMLLILIIQITAVISITKFFYKVIESRDENNKKFDRIDWYNIVQIVYIIIIIVSGKPYYRFSAMLLLMGYLLQFYGVLDKVQRCILLTIEALIACGAYWLQPFVVFPSIISLELNLIPVAVTAYSLKYIWEKSRTLEFVRVVIYCFCLGILTMDAMYTQKIEDALIIGMISLIIFAVSIIIKNKLWTKISGILLIFLSIYLTRGFWLSIAWWVYLLVVGIGLITFAAINEFKKRQ
ncbi:MAG: hypothetical protein Q8900_04810 [Bacillota bacterium]|nr:hypothetical protein [Bacillota bacterium]